MQRLLAIFTLTVFMLPFAMPATAAGNAGAGKHNKKQSKPKKNKRAKQNPAK
jgi:hypothetical protein